MFAKALTLTAVGVVAYPNLVNCDLSGSGSSGLNSGEGSLKTSQSIMGFPPVDSNTLISGPSTLTKGQVATYTLASAFKQGIVHVSDGAIASTASQFSSTCSGKMIATGQTDISSQTVTWTAPTAEGTYTIFVLGNTNSGSASA